MKIGQSKKFIIKAGMVLFVGFFSLELAIGQMILPESTEQSQEPNHEIASGIASLPFFAMAACVPGTVNRFTGSYHSNLYIGNANGVNMLLAWGQNMKTYTTGSGGDYTAPFFVSTGSYSGIPYEVRSSSTGGASGPSVLAMRTSTKFYVFGNSANISSITTMANFGATALTSPNADITNKLPAGVGIADIAQFAVSPTAIGIVTTAGNVYMLTQMQTLQGDNTVAGPAIWHQVKLSNGTALSGVVKFSLSGSGAFALTATGKLYYWGKPANVNGSINTVTSYNYAFDMTAQIPTGTAVVELVVLGKDTGPNDLFILCNNLKVYSCGLNDAGVLGVGNASITFNQASFQPVSGLNNIVHIDGNTEASLFTMAAMSTTGRIYGWGDGVACMLGIAWQSSFTSTYTNTVPVDIFGVDGFMDFSISGHFTIAFFTNPITAVDQYCYVGHNTGGSIGLPSIAAAVINQAAIARLDAPTPISFNCSNTKPTINIAESITAFNTCIGAASTNQMIVVSGSNMIHHLTITAPEGFEISSSVDTGYSSTSTLTNNGGIIGATNIYIRIGKGSTSSVSGNLVFSSKGATTQNLVLTGTVNSLPLIETVIAATRSGPGTVTVSGTVTPAMGTTIDWFAGSTAGTALKVGSLNYLTGILDSTTVFYAEARNTSTGCISILRVPVIATINKSFTAGSIKANQSICFGATAETLNSVTAASGGTGSISYQWQSSLDNSSFTNILGATLNEYTPVGLMQTTYYKRLAITVADGSIPSNTVCITVNPIPVVSLPVDNARTGVGPVVLSANPSTSATLDWYATNSGGFVLVGGNGVTIFTTPSILVTTTFYVEARNSITGCVSSNRIPVIATVNESFLPGSISSSQSLCLGNAALPLNSVTDASGGTGIINYQWQVSTISNSTGFTDIPAANASTYSPGMVTQNSFFRRVASTINDGNIYSNVVGVLINSLPNSATAINGSRTGAGTVNIGAIVPEGETTDWYAFSTGESILSGGLGTTSFTTPSIASTTNYYALARNTNNGCVSQTRTLVVASIVIPKPVITVAGTLNAFTACIGSISSEQSFTVSASNLVANLLINAPTGYELSKGTGTGFASDITLVPVAGSVTLITIFIRLASTASNGIAGNIQISSTNAIPQTLATGVATVNPTPVFNPGFIAGITTTATNFSIPFTASNANQFSISVGSRALSGFIALSNQSLSGTNLIIPVPPSLSGQYDFNVLVRNSITGCVSALIPVGLNIEKQNPIISLADITKNNNDPSFTIAAVSNSSGAINYASSNLAVATISGNQVSIIGTGTSIITATQVADENYYTARTTALLIVSELIPRDLIYPSSNFFTIDATISPLFPSVVGTPTAYSISPALPAGLSIHPTTGIISGKPTEYSATKIYTVTASNPVGSVTANVSITINKIANNLTLGNLSKSYGDPNFTIAAFSNSTGAISYSIDNNAVASIAGATVSILNAGTSTITATQLEDDKYVTATTTATLIVNKISANLSLANITKNYGDPDFDVHASSNSSGSFSYSIANPAIATILGNTIQLHQVGNTTITVQQVASDNYLSGTTSATLTVRENAPTGLSYPGPNLYSLLNPIAALTPSVSGTVTNYSISPGLPAGLNINSSSGVISGTPSQATQAIIYKITASNTAGSISATVSIAVNKLIPTISLNEINKTYGAPDFIIAAISNSPGKIYYSVNNTSIATVIGNRVTLKSGGIATITASQEATDQFEAATVKAQLLVNDLPKIGLEYPLINILTIDKTIQPIKPIEQGVFTGFSISPSLPTGLSIDSKTGYINGTPNALSKLTAYTVIATNGLVGFQATLNIQVNDMAPVFVFQPEIDIANPRLPIKMAIPLSTGGKVVNYSISPALPEGIELDAKTGIIAGKIVSVKNGLQEYSVTGTNSGGVATAKYTLLFNSAPSDIVLTNQQVLENLPSSTQVGLLNTADVDGGDAYSYELVSGIGSNDNAFFEIRNNVLVSKTSFNFEQKSDYQIRIQTTDEGGLKYEKSFHILIIDLNEVPTLAPLGDIRLYNLTTEQEIGLFNLSAGNDVGQSLEVQLSSSKINLFKVLKVVGNRILFTLKPDVFGNDILIKVLVKDNGGVANGGVDTVVRTFVLGIDPLPKVTATPTQISPGKTSQLQVEAAHAIEYRWNNINAIVGSTGISNPVIRPIPNDLFIVTVKNKWGYTAQGSVKVDVVLDYTLASKNILTPNGDGHNDRWIIDNIEFYPNSEVAVYDKSGKLVFKEIGYRNQWDGKLNGVALKEDTYFYIIQFNKPNVKPIKGYLTVIH
jgi:gliding motility-associated-like protein